MSHITMFTHSKNELGYLQVVTHADNKKELESGGFVDHVDKVKKPKSKSKESAKSNKG